MIFDDSIAEPEPPEAGLLLSGAELSKFKLFTVGAGAKGILKARSRPIRARLAQSRPIRARLARSRPIRARLARSRPIRAIGSATVCKQYIYYCTYFLLNTPTVEYTSNLHSVSFRGKNYTVPSALLENLSDAAIA